MSDPLVQSIIGCRTATETLAKAAEVLATNRELAYDPLVERTVTAALSVLDPSTRLKRHIVMVLQQFYRFPYGISA